jgi:hypothetical protein
VYLYPVAIGCLLCAFHAHRIALLASSEAFRAMFNQNFRERDASSIEIPNIRYDVFQVGGWGGWLWACSAVIKTASAAYEKEMFLLVGGVSMR